MSILYRAVWSDVASARDSGTIDGLKTCVAAWVQESAESAPVLEGRSEFEVSQGRHRQVSVRSIGSRAFEVTATDQVPGDSTEWVTTIRVVADDEGVHTLVELSMLSDDLARRVSVGRPKIVHELLEVAEKPRIGGNGVLIEPLALPVNGIAVLTEMLANPDRTLPIIVCAEPNGSHDGEWLRTAGSIAARAEGGRRGDHARSERSQGIPKRVRPARDLGRQRARVRTWCRDRGV